MASDSQALPPLDIDWPGYHRLIERLALIVYESDFRFRRILCLARGGMRPGDVLSRVFDVPLAVLVTSSYREKGGTVAGALDIAERVTSTGGEIAGPVLLVDDMVDSGVTLQRVVEHLRKQYPAITEMRTAVIWYKDISIFVPDYFVEKVEGNRWINQPFEYYDTLRPAQLAEKMKRGS